MECPAHSHYEICADTCSLGCSTITTPIECLDTCSEGCECDTDYLQSITGCVPMEKCGCHHNGVYYEVGTQPSRQNLELPPEPTPTSHQCCSLPTTQLPDYLSAHICPLPSP